MAASALLDRLTNVRRTGDGRWLARCPAHADKSPSLSVRELSDGRVLVHCFSGCSFEQVIATAGVSIDELFPPRATTATYTPRGREPFPAADVLRALADELGVIAIIAGDVFHARAVSAEDFDRLRVAVGRVRAARELALGRPG